VKLSGAKVVIAGAGLAGLTAAHTLSQLGASVRVFEARDRLGGRVWTLRGPPFAPFHAELGGELIESHHTAIRALCRAFDLPLRRVLLRGFGLVISQHGRARVWPRQTPLWKQFSAHFTRQAEAFEGANRDWSSTVAAAIARRSVNEVLERRKASSTVKALAVALRNLYVADPDDLSAMMTVEEILAGGDPSALVAYRIAGGNDRLVEALANHGRGRIDRRQIVRAVAHDAQRVHVGIEGPGGRLSTIAADYLVLALPITLVRELVFNPPLPESQRHAFGRIDDGPATKAILRYASPWWRTPGLPRAFGTNLPIGAVWDASEDQQGGALLALLAGGRASAMLAKRLQTASGRRAIARQLAWLNGGPPDAPDVHSVTWESDPWARGAYAYFSPKFEPALQPLLGRGVGRVLFAGSHTSREFPGYMNGAVESGQRVVREITQLARL
jgi:monoamine oxidase